MEDLRWTFIFLAESWRKWIAIRNRTRPSGNIIMCARRFCVEVFADDEYCNGDDLQ